MLDFFLSILYLDFYNYIEIKLNGKEKKICINIIIS